MTRMVVWIRNSRNAAGLPCSNAVGTENAFSLACLKMPRQVLAQNLLKLSWSSRQSWLGATDVHVG